MSEAERVGMPVRGVQKQGTMTQAAIFKRNDVRKSATASSVAVRRGHMNRNAAARKAQWETLKWNSKS
jgi:hypothetical protein